MEETNEQVKEDRVGEIASNIGYHNVDRLTLKLTPKEIELYWVAHDLLRSEHSVYLLRVSEKLDRFKQNELLNDIIEAGGRRGYSPSRIDRILLRVRYVPNKIVLYRS